MFKLKNKLNREECEKLLAKENFNRVAISMYRYVKLKDLHQLRDELFTKWSKLQVLGRIYIASEGINAQFCVPEHNVEKFRACIEEYEEFKNMRLNIGHKHTKSFIKLSIKIKKQIVADGLDENAYDWGQIGQHLDAEDFNELISKEDTVLIDMRNHYESRIGHFEGAQCPDVDTFKEQLPVVRDMLKGKEDKNVAIYCTGGIRCEKASAYLKSQGVENVYQLNGGIINYARQLEQKNIKSKFIGKNYVFDDRIDETITDDILTVCDQCDQPCDTYVNCKEKSCNLLFIQCEACTKKFEGCCCEKCQEVTHWDEQKQREYRKSRPKMKAKIYKRPKIQEKICV